MKLGIVGKDRPEQVYLAVHNDEVSADLTQGRACCFVMDGTEDGVAVVSSTTGAAGKATSLFAGIITDIGGLANGKYGVSQVFGLCYTATLLLRTRAASTDSWATHAAGVLGDLLSIDTVNALLQRTAAGAASAFLAFAALASAYASAATGASDAGQTGTASTLSTRVFLRAM